MDHISGDHLTRNHDSLSVSRTDHKTLCRTGESTTQGEEVGHSRQLPDPIPQKMVINQRNDKPSLGLLPDFWYLIAFYSSIVCLTRLGKRSADAYVQYF